MSLDALHLVCEYMSPAGRLNLAQTSTGVCNELTRWEDVHSLLLGDTKVLMAGEVFRHKIDIGRDLALFPITLRHVVLTGIVLSRPLMDTILTLTNLRHFDAIGCVIDTNLGADYVEKLAQLSNLDEMSMPPSMFSFSVREENKIKFSMRKLRLSRLSLFMEQFDEDTFFEQLETIMPKKLKTLILYGNYFPLKKSKKYAVTHIFVNQFANFTDRFRFNGNTSQKSVVDERRMPSDVTSCTKLSV
ncbi:unnamed protein product [Angiostrongylus costaricensis]|uniref:F-box domain-containing protein n=1 Tax=Angiostrongylus costaricensis TaxID=334426 RepID=A0A0R3PSB9_ANGCS|nr:unnamed protein product [Angiostrongylus costaricensis]